MGLRLKCSTVSEVLFNQVFYYIDPEISEFRRFLQRPVLQHRRRRRRIPTVRPTDAQVTADHVTIDDVIVVGILVDDVQKLPQLRGLDRKAHPARPISETPRGKIPRLFRRRRRQVVGVGIGVESTNSQSSTSKSSNLKTHRLHYFWTKS